MVTRGYAGPLPTVDFGRQVSAAVYPPFVGVVSGELAGHRKDMPLGMGRYAGKVTGVYMSVGSCGKDDSDVPRVSGEVYINGVSCLTTKPAIGHVSGEAAQQKTTFSSASDTAVAAAVVNHSANTVSEGDVLTWEVIYSGSAAPTTKARSVCIIVEVQPT